MVVSYESVGVYLGRWLGIEFLGIYYMVVLEKKLGRIIGGVGGKLGSNIG